MDFLLTSCIQVGMHSEKLEMRFWSGQKLERESLHVKIQSYERDHLGSVGSAPLTPETNFKAQREKNVRWYHGEGWNI